MVKKPDFGLQDVASFYNSRFEKEGDSIKSVGWSTKESQQLRFKVLLENFKIEGKTILDVGCGLADLIPFLTERFGGNFRYIGLDISEKLIDTARTKYALPNCQFFVGDILTTEMDTSGIDYVIESGAFSFKISDNYRYVKAAMGKMYDIANEGIALNFLTSYVDYKLEKNFHYDPEIIFSWALKLSRFASISHDYNLWEFTVRILKSPIER